MCQSVQGSHERGRAVGSADYVAIVSCSRGKRAALAGFACAALLGSAVPAGAQTFTVCGLGCNFATITAANASASVHNGDELVVEPGVYTDAPALTKVLSVHGDPSKSRPVIAPAGEFTNALTLEAGSAGSAVSDLALEPKGIDGAGFAAAATATFTDLTIKAARSFAIGAPHVTVSDVVSSQTSNLGINVNQEGTTLRHVQVTWAPEGGGLLLALFSGAGTVIEDSSFVSPTTNIPLAVNIGGTPGPTILRRVRVEAGGQAMYAGGPTTITDSLVTADAGPAIEAISGAVTLRNDTLISTAPGEKTPSAGITARGCSGTGCTPGTVAAVDVIARGAIDDVKAEPASGSPGAAGAIAIEHSNLVTQAGAVTGGANQSANPLFVNPTIGPAENFRLSPGSPAIDAGVVDAFTGPTDLDGNPRVQGAAVDLGAYEFAPPPLATPISAPAPPPPPAPKAPAATLALAGHTVKIDPRTGTGSLPVTCSAKAGDQCAVVGSLSASLRAAKGAAVRKTAGATRLGTVTGTVKGPPGGRVSIRLTAAALTKLRRLHHVNASLTAAVTSAGGVTHLTGQVKLVLGAPAHHRGH
jgi:hypothetical protein